MASYSFLSCLGLLSFQFFILKNFPSLFTTVRPFHTPTFLVILLILSLLSITRFNPVFIPLIHNVSGFNKFPSRRPSVSPIPSFPYTSSSHSFIFSMLTSPEGFADEATSLLANHLAPGHIFAQDQVGALNQDPTTAASSALAQWEKTPLEDIQLSTLERIFTHKQADRAQRLLSRKIRINIDPRYILPSPNALFRSTSRLDFFAAIPQLPGLSVILPPQHIIPPLWWNFKLDLRSPHRHFHFKHGKLGFRPDHATCYIGSTDSLDIWALFVPDEKLDDDAKTLPAGTAFSAPTQLSSKHLRQFYSWLLYCLSSIGYPGMYLRSDRRYAVNLDHNRPNWSFVADFRYHHTHFNLSL